MNVESAGGLDDAIPRVHQLREEHSRYSKQLQSLSDKPYLSEDEKLEEVRLKKLKLRLKDQMSALLRSPA